MAKGRATSVELTEADTNVDLTEAELIDQRMFVCTIVSF